MWYEIEAYNPILFQHAVILRVYTKFIFAIEFGCLYHLEVVNPAVSYLHRDVIGDVRFISRQATYHINKDKTTSREVSSIMRAKGTNFDVLDVTI